MVNPKRFYTYAYLREDKTPYYIGKGNGGRIYAKRKHIRLPKDKSRIIFLKQNLTEEEAFKHEKYMIAVFGRKDLGTGILHNKTDGGEGIFNPSSEIRKKISSSLTGRILSEKHKKNISIAKSHPTQVEISRKNAEKRRGIPLSEDHKKKLSKSGIGKNKGSSNGNYGKTWYTDGIRNIMSFECPQGFYKGYTNKVSSKEWKITFENGKIVNIDCLTTWCKENGYSPANVTNVYRKRIKKHKDIIDVEQI